MAKIKLGPLVEQISGSVGGVTFRRTKSGDQVYVQPPPLQHVSTRQRELRGYFAAAVQAWTGLSAGARSVWINGVKTISRPDNIGPSRAMSARDFFLQWAVTVLEGEPDYDLTDTFFGQFGYGFISHYACIPGEPDGVMVIAPSSTIYPPKPSPINIRSDSVYIGIGAPLQPAGSPASYPTRSLPRRWVKLWPQRGYTGNYKTMNLYKPLIAALTGWPGTDPAILTEQLITRDVWIRYKSVMEHVIYDSGPVPLFSAPTSGGIQVPVYYPAILPNPSAEWNPS